MRILERFRRSETFYGRTALTVGNFEGYHRGHREIVRRLLVESRARGLFSTVITFKRHPVAVLTGREPDRLWAPADRIACFMREGIDLLVTVDFTPELAGMTPGEFLSVLSNAFSPKLLCLGGNFRFGRDNAGTIDFLRDESKRFGYELLVVNDLRLHGKPVSSTRIREAVKQGNFPLVTELLGRKYSVQLIYDPSHTDVFAPFIANIALPLQGVFEGEVEDSARGGRVPLRVRVMNRALYPQSHFSSGSGPLPRYYFEK